MHSTWSRVFDPPAPAPRSSIRGLWRKIVDRPWVDDEELDLAGHVSVLEGGPVSLERFGALTDAVRCEPLHANRALWHVYLVPQLADGRIGVIFKTSPDERLPQAARLALEARGLALT
jgi:hypothetical protein